MMKEYSEESVRLLLALACRKVGSQQQFAKLNHISSAYVNDVINGRRMPGKSILAALGLVRVVMYAKQKR